MSAQSGMEASESTITPLLHESPEVGQGEISSTSRCKVYCTVVTGFESTARDDCKECFGPDITDVYTERGALKFSIPLSRIPDLLTLRSVDHLYAVVLEATKKFDEDKGVAIKEVREFAIRTDVNWKAGFAVWREATRKLDKERFDKNHIGIPKNFDDASDYNPSFRATCYRTGTHSFNSQEAMVEFGGGLNSTYGWKVDLKNYDVEAVLIIEEEKVSVCLSLTREPLFRRNITHFGSSTLRSTIAYNMLRLGEPKPGDVICDPMCGSGAIPVEAALSYPSCYVLGGDNYEVAAEKMTMNVRDIPFKNGRTLENIDSIQWDVGAFPLRGRLVDLWVSDFPFGKRHKCHRRTLYPLALDAMAKASKLGVTRAVIVTADRGAMWDAVKNKKQWFIKRTININLGGLTAVVFILLRTCLP